MPSLLSSIMCLHPWQRLRGHHLTVHEGLLELPLKGYYVFSNSKGNTTFDIQFTWGDIGYLQNNEDFANQLDDYIQAVRHALNA